MGEIGMDELSSSLTNGSIVYEGETLSLYSYEDYGDYYKSIEELASSREGKEFDRSKIVTLEFVGRFAGHDDVIKKTYQGGRCKYLTAVRRECSLIYDEEDGLWGGSYGNLRREYKALSDIGIVFMNDPYKKMDELLAYLKKVAEEENNKHHVMRPKDKK